MIFKQNSLLVLANFIEICTDYTQFLSSHEEYGQ